MRINFLITNPALHGGGRVTAIHAGYLKRAGHDVRVITLPKPRVSALDKALLDPMRKAAGRPRWRRVFQTGFFDREGIALIHAAQPDKITADDVPDADVTIATWWETAEWLEDLPAEKGAQVHFVQDDEAKFDHVDTARVERVYRAPTHKIAVSQWLRDAVINDYGRSDAFLVENAVDLDLFKAAGDAARAHPAVGFLHNGSRRKNVALSYTASRVLKEQFPDLTVEVFGRADPGEIDDLEAWMTYHRSPAQDDIAKIYSRCTAWLFTSESEGFGLPILEAMACRTPVVATRAGAAPQLINGENGVLVDHSLDGVVEGARALVSMAPDEWARASQAAFETARVHQWDRACKAFEAALREIVA